MKIEVGTDMETGDYLCVFFEASGGCIHEKKKDFCFRLLKFLGPWIFEWRLEPMTTDGYLLRLMTMTKAKEGGEG